MSQTVYFEDFENGNDDFVPASGTFTVVDEINKVYQTNALNSTTPSASLLNVNVGDGQISTLLKPTAWSTGECGAGLIFRMSGDSTFYTAVFENAQIKCKYHANGNYTTIVSKPYACDAGTWYTLSVYMAGTSVSIYVNGILEVTGILPTNTTGKIGFIAYNGNIVFDNFKLVTTPTQNKPEIYSFTPTSGKVGTNVTLTGKYFTGVNSVKIGQQTASYVFVNDTTLTCVIPEGAQTGIFTVYTANGQGISPTLFEVETSPVTVLYKEDFEDGQSDFAIVTGSFSIVDFNGGKVFKTTASSSGARAIVGDSTWGNINFSSDVYINSLASGASNTVGLMTRYIDVNNYYLAIYEDGKLMINKKVKGSFTSLVSKSFSPELGKWYSFQVNLDGTSIKFLVDGVEQLSTTDSTFTSGKVGYVVFSASASFDNMLVTTGVPPPPSKPTISSISPTSGIQGTYVTITGTNFTDVTGVKFGSVDGAYQVDSSTKITSVAPPGGTGAVVVNTANGSATGPVFTVTDVPPVTPTISGMSPTQGTVGTNVTITGTNFINVESVKFGNVSAIFTLNSTTKISAVAPSGGTGVVTVKTNTGTATGPIFTVQEEPAQGILYSFDAKDGQGILELENDQNTSYAYRIDNAPVTNEKAFRFEVRAAGPDDGDSQRSELKIYRGDWHADMHKDYWYGFKIMLDPTWKTGGDRWCMVAQWHDIPDGIDSQQLEEWRHPVLSLATINDKWKILYRFDPNKISDTSDWSAFDKLTLGNPANAYAWQGQIDTPDPTHWWESSLSGDIGRWVKWIFHVRWEYDNNAVLEVWKDDVKVISAPSHPVCYNDDLGPTCKFGIYRNKPGQISGVPAQDRITYVNKYIVGDSSCNYTTVSNFIGGTTPPPPVNPPTITSISPTSGPSGAQITITGTNFM